MAVSLVFTVESLADAEVPWLPPPLVVADDPVVDVLAEVAEEPVGEVLPVGPVVVAPEAVELSTAVDAPVALVPVVLIPALSSRSVPESSDEQLTSSMAPAPSTNL